MIDNIEKRKGSFEFMILLLSEGVNEKIDNFPELVKEIGLLLHIWYEKKKE